jgi:carboxypeptidase C (cathepsin A)
MFSVEGDVDALAECIRAHLTRSKRWGSPIYLAGESYGTTRGAALADKLLDLGIALAGVILVSCAMDIQSLDFEGKNDLAYALFVPGFAATAQYHGKLAGPQAKSGAAARSAAEEFVTTEYLAALHLGARLPAAKRKQIAQRLSELIGLPAQVILDNDLRVSDATFFSELLRDEGKIVGRLEARVTGPLGAKKSRAWDFDPGLEALVGPYTMAANAYFQSVLGISTDQKYAVFSDIAHKEWNWLQDESKGNSYTSTSNSLARALRRNPHLRVLVASGYYDLGTPYSASDWSLSRLDLTPEVMARITHHYYDAGHMMYTRTDDLLKLKADLKNWLQA